MIKGPFMDRRAQRPRIVGATAFCAVVALLLGGCAETGVGELGAATPPPPPGPAAGNGEVERAANRYLSASTPGSAGYLVGPQDVLEITVFQAPDLSKTVQVDENGMINLPLLGQISAAGKSSSALERELQKRLDARYMKASQVGVFVKEYNSQRVTIEGAIKTPGVVGLRGGETLMQVIAKSGGLERETASSEVVVFRTTNGARSATRYDISAIQSGAAEDPQILPGDVVVVNDSMTKTGLNLVLKVLPLAGTAAFLY